MSKRDKGFTLLAALAFLSEGNSANADIVISSQPTSNMTCSAGVCSPTATLANLNVTELETALQSGNMIVRTTGTGVQATDIDVKAELSWQSSNTLALDAWQSIRIERHTTVAGTGGLSIVTNDGGKNGTFSFGPKGRVSFAGLTNSLTINGVSFTLVNSIRSLASALAANAGGDYALSDNYDASGDGTYSGIPIPATISGTVEGLGNTISYISVTTKKEQFASGLFYVITFGGTVENLGVDALTLKMESFCCAGGDAAGFVLESDGLLFGDHVTGSISMDAHRTTGSVAAGFLAVNDGTIKDSYSTASVYTDGGIAGGFVGQTFDATTISQSFATGKVTVVYEANYAYGGGFAATNEGPIFDSYSTGAMQGEGDAPLVGGFTGVNDIYQIATSYSTGQVTTGTDGHGGGFLGKQVGSCADCYWDTDTSGQSQGTGTGGDTGIAGLTTKQLKSGLPAGFDPSIWTKKKGVNHGFPYLIDNPPPE